MGLFGTNRSHQSRNTFQSVQKFIQLKRKTNSEVKKVPCGTREPSSKRRRLEKEYNKIVIFVEEDKRIRETEKREITERVKELEVKLEDLRRQKRELFRQVKEMKNEEERRKMQDWEERMRTEYMLASQQYQRSLSQQQQEQPSAEPDPRSSATRMCKDSSTPAQQFPLVTSDPRTTGTEVNSLDPRLHGVRDEQRPKLTLPISTEQTQLPGVPAGDIGRGYTLTSPPLQGFQDANQGIVMGNRDNQPPPLMSPVAMRPPPEMQALSNFSPPGPPQGMMDMTRPPLLGFHPPRLGSTHSMIPSDSIPPPLIPPPVGQFAPQLNQGMPRPPFIVGDQFWQSPQNAHLPFTQRHSSTGSSGSSPIGSPGIVNFGMFPKTQ